MRFGVLGPVRVDTCTGPVPVSGRLRTGLLSLLLVRANGAVPAESLVAAFWGDDDDPAHRQRLQTNVHKLRRALGEPLRLSFEAGSYRLRVDPGELDADRFEALTSAAAATEDPRRRVELLREALGLWRGRPFQGLDLAGLLVPAQRLDECRRTAIEDLYSAELECGRHREVVAELADVARRHPLRERLQALLMTALYRSGRQVDALAAYRRTRRTLVEQLGLEPGPELRHIEQTILVGEDPAVGAPVGTPPCRPAELPRAPRDFVGRRVELAALDEFGAAENGASVVVVSGTAGVGKTALVTHWAHGAKERFPDGQLYVDLQGFSPNDPLPATAALGGFLRSLGEDPAAIPSNPLERAARFRTRSDGRRLLVVLDNAATAEQVRPLLPGASSCVVLVTSRDRLGGLAAGEGAHRLEVGRMTHDDARALLSARVGDAVLARGRGTALIERCSRLPLALRVVVERLAAPAGPDVARLLAELHNEEDRLDLLETGDDHTSVRAVLSWSYRRLAPEAARLYRLCGFRCPHPGHHLDVHGAAALLGTTDLRTARRLLGELVCSGLMEVAPDGRHRMHDLLRVYAVELADRFEADTDAPLRLLGHYLQTAISAAGFVQPRETALLSSGLPPVSTPELAGCAAALQWLDTRRPSLLCAAESAARTDLPNVVVDLSTTLWPYLDLGQHLDESRRLHTLAHAAARELGDLPGEGIVLRALGLLALRLGRTDEAVSRMREALELHSDGGDRALNVTTTLYLAAASAADGRVDDAVRLGRAVEPDLNAEDATADARLAMPLNALGWFLRQRGRPREALRYLQLASDIPAVHLAVRIRSLNDLAETYRDLGADEDAASLARRASDLAAGSGIRDGRGTALTVQPGQWQT